MHLCSRVFEASKGDAKGAAALTCDAHRLIMPRFPALQESFLDCCNRANKSRRMYRPHFDAAVLLRPHEVLPQLDHERIVEIPVHHKKRVQLNSSGEAEFAELTPSDRSRCSRAARLPKHCLGRHWQRCQAPRMPFARRSSWDTGTARRCRAWPAPPRSSRLRNCLLQQLREALEDAKELLHVPRLMCVSARGMCGQ